MTEHTVDVEVAFVAWDDDDLLVDLVEAPFARPELVGPAVGADLRRRSVGITVTVESSDPVAAKAIAQRALQQVVAALGFARMIP
jgi:hypothetical protein